MYVAETYYECEWVAVHAVGYAKGQSKRKGKGKGKDGERAGNSSGNNSAGKTWQEEADCFPNKCHNYGEKGHEAAQCGKDRKRLGKSGVDGVEEGDADENGAEAARGFGDLDLCAVEDVWEVGAGKTSAVTSRATSRWASWTTTRSIRGPSPSTPSPGMTRGMSSNPGRTACTEAQGTPSRRCRAPRRARGMRDMA